MFDKGFIWNPSNCECDCDKSCDIGEYLDYKNCKCRKKITCMVYIVLFVIFLITSIYICSVFIYFHWCLKKDNIRTNFNVGYLNK